MFRKIINGFNESLVFKKQKTKKKNKNVPVKKVDKLYEVITDQADSINFLIQQLDLVRNKSIELARQVRELKKQLREKE